MASAPTLDHAGHSCAGRQRVLVRCLPGLLQDAGAGVDPGIRVKHPRVASEETLDHAGPHSERLRLARCGSGDPGEAWFATASDVTLDRTGAFGTEDEPTPSGGKSPQSESIDGTQAISVRVGVKISATAVLCRICIVRTLTSLRRQDTNSRESYFWSDPNRVVRQGLHSLVRGEDLFVTPEFLCLPDGEQAICEELANMFLSDSHCILLRYRQEILHAKLHLKEVIGIFDREVEDRSIDWRDAHWSRVGFPLSGIGSEGCPPRVTRTYGPCFTIVGSAGFPGITRT